MRAGPIVTTTIARTLQRDVPASASTRYHIGGTVLDGATPPQPVALAWVELLTTGNERRAFTRADALGRFVFADVAAGACRLQASAVPLGASAPRDVSVPEPTGSYDVVF